MELHFPLVTIGIPTHNRAGTYLHGALECALRQTYPALEIIVADNRSTDGTAELVARHADPRLRYFRHDPELRPNDNFNFCLNQARGKYFLLLLDDELVDHDFVSTCVAAAGAHPGAGLIRTGLRSIDANGTVIRESPNEAAGLPLGELFLAWFEGHTRFYLCNTLFNTRVLRGIGGFHSRHCLFQDVMAQVQIVSRHERVDVRAVKASTRSHLAQNTYAAKVEAWAEDAMDLLNLMCEVAPQQQALIRAKGAAFFAAICYSRASAIRSPRERLRAYNAVYRRFDGRYMPTVRTVLRSTALYRQLRYIKRRLKGQPVWAAAG